MIAFTVGQQVTVSGYAFHNAYIKSDGNAPYRYTVADSDGSLGVFHHSSITPVGQDPLPWLDQVKAFAADLPAIREQLGIRSRRQSLAEELWPNSREEVAK